jgi:hypothetical protein
MLSTRIAASGLIFLCLALVFAMVPQRATSRLAPAQSAPQSGNEEPVPAFHSEVPQGPLPATMSPTLFTNLVAQNAYTIAAHIKKVLYQQPCYCHCDRSQGHASLLDCFVSKHAAGCEICMREGFYSYELTHKDRSSAQIREGIERGEWRQVDLSKYQAPLPAK